MERNKDPPKMPSRFVQDQMTRPYWGFERRGNPSNIDPALPLPHRRKASRGLGYNPFAEFKFDTLSDVVAFCDSNDLANVGAGNSLDWTKDTYFGNDGRADSRIPGFGKKDDAAKKSRLKEEAMERRVEKEREKAREWKLKKRRDREMESMVEVNEVLYKRPKSWLDEDGDVNMVDSMELDQDERSFVRRWQG